MKQEIKISYHWSCNQGIPIPEKHREALEEDARERIFEMLKEGYTSRELITSVRYGKDVVPEEEDNGLDYFGWFSINTANIE